jgi:hypothetical protein
VIFWPLQDSQKIRLPKNKKNCFLMKGIFWNSRGLSDLAKYRYISEAVRDHKLDFLAIMETGKHDMSKVDLAWLSGGADFTWHCLPARGRSGGILLGAKVSALDISLIVEGEFLYQISFAQ